MHILCNTGTSLYFWVKCLVKIAVDGETARDGYLTENVKGEITFFYFFLSCVKIKSIYNQYKTKILQKMHLACIVLC